MFYNTFELNTIDLNTINEILPPSLVNAINTNTVNWVNSGAVIRFPSDFHNTWELPNLFHKSFKPSEELLYKTLKAFYKRKLLNIVESEQELVNKAILEYNHFFNISWTLYDVVYNHIGLDKIIIYFKAGNNAVKLVSYNISNFLEREDSSHFMFTNALNLSDWEIL